MSNETNFSLVNLGNLTKPASLLIEKISNASGVLFTPRQVRRLASANRDAKVIEAEAAREVAKIEAQSEIEITDLHRRAADRWIDEEARRQKNMEDITAKALASLEPDAQANEMEDDWIVNFFDKGRLISDDKMQQLWARILAGEANAPGTFSKRTVNFMSNIDSSEAELFANLCRFICMINWLNQPLILDESHSIYKSLDITFYNLNQLDAIGLINHRTEDFALNLGKGFTIPVIYGAKSMLLDTNNMDSGQLSIGRVMLTKIGRELAPLCVSEPVEGFYEYVKDQWAQYVFDAASPEPDTSAP